MLIHDGPTDVRTGYEMVIASCINHQLREILVDILAMQASNELKEPLLFVDGYFNANAKPVITYSYPVVVFIPP